MLLSARSTGRRLYFSWVATLCLLFFVRHMTFELVSRSCLGFSSVSAILQAISTISNPTIPGLTSLRLVCYVGSATAAFCCRYSPSPLHRSKPLPPLVFIHGSYHAGWCWAEHWMPFLAAKGYETYSISLRGTSGTPIPGTEVRPLGVSAPGLGF